MSYKPLLLTTAFAIPASLMLPLSPILAADISWDNVETGLFTDALNWDTDTVPTAADTAIIANGGTAQLQESDFESVGILRISQGTLDATDAFLSTGLTSSSWQSTGDLQVGGTAGQSGSLTTAGNTAISTGRVRIGGYNTSGGGDSADIHGTLTMSGSSSLETASGGGYDFWLGNGPGSTATLNMSGTSRITVNSSMTSGRAGGHATVNLSGNSKFEVSTFGNIGEGGTAEWTVGDEAELTFGGNLTMGGSNGQLTVKDLATVSIGGEFQIGNGGGNLGTVVFSGGTITASSWMSIGREGGSGSVAMSGNAVLVKAGGGNLIVGDGTTGTMTVSGNASIVSNSDIWVGLNNGGNGSLTISGGSSQTSGVVIVARGNGSQGRLDLNGGTLTTNVLQEGDNTGAGNGTVHFNGGTLRAGAASSNFIANFETGDVVIDAGGARIDTNAFDIEISLALVGDGGLVKAGLGTLTLSGANLYLGDTAVETGVLSITSGFLNDAANVHLAEGTVFNLNFVGTDTVNGLVIDGVGMTTGTWGAVDSGADHESSMFTGTGMLLVTTVVPEPSTIALVIAGLGAVGWGLRRRR